jgi:anti-sigma B factor antagonist
MITETKNGKQVVFLNGEINAKTGSEYKEAIKAMFNNHNTFVVSFKDVVYLNSSGLREIIDLLKSSNASKKEIRLTEMSKDIREMFSFTGLDKIFKIYDTQKSALE